MGKSRSRRGSNQIFVVEFTVICCGDCWCRWEDGGEETWSRMRQECRSRCKHDRRCWGRLLYGESLWRLRLCAISRCMRCSRRATRVSHGLLRRKGRAQFFLMFFRICNALDLSWFLQFLLQGNNPRHRVPVPDCSKSCNPETPLGTVKSLNDTGLPSPEPSGGGIKSMLGVGVLLSCGRPCSLLE